MAEQKKVRQKIQENKCNAKRSRDEEEKKSFPRGPKEEMWACSLQEQACMHLELETKLLLLAGTLKRTSTRGFYTLCSARETKMSLWVG